MKDILLNIQNKLGEIPALGTVDEDWGQLDLYRDDFPVKWPCCLFDVGSGTFDNVAKGIQNGLFTLELTVAKVKLSNTGLRAPKTQKDNAWDIYSILQEIHRHLQGFRPQDNCSGLVRTATKRIRRDDGIQEYRITYTFEVFGI